MSSVPPQSAKRACLILEICILTDSLFILSIQKNFDFLYFTFFMQKKPCFNLQPDASKIESTDEKGIRFTELADKTIYYNEAGEPVLEVSDYDDE